MHIIFQHNHILPIQRYGGTERLIFWLMKYLVREGHRVTLIGHPKSKVKEFGINLIPQLCNDWRSLIPENSDVIHLFDPLRFELTTHPCLTTIGGNGRPGELFDLNTVFVSKSHAKNHCSESFVHNGIDLAEYPKHENAHKDGSWNNFLFLAKASWKVKNLAHCIRGAKEAKKHLHIAGGRAWGLSNLFSSYIHSHGMVDQNQKQELFKRMDALLFPVRWPEPFGLAIVEAFAAGLPVIGSCYGSLPELITPSTGIICKSYEELLDALTTSPSYQKQKFNRDEIRAHVERNYSIEVMGKKYLELYKKVMAGDKLNLTPPTFRSGHSPNATAETLLPF